MKKGILLVISVFTALMGISQVWSPVPSGTDVQLNSVSFGSELVGYIGANDSTLLKTTDGGNTWGIHPTSGLDFSNGVPHITQVDFVSADTGFLILGTLQFSGAMYKTVDGGDNWTPESMNMCSPTFSYNFDADNSYVVGSACFGAKTIGKKVDGVWESAITYLAFGYEYLRTITFYDTLYGITAGDSGAVHRTFDGGLNWDEVPTLSKEIIWDLQFVNDSTIYGITDSLQNTLMISTDSGATWAEHTHSLTFFYPRLKALTGTQNEGIVAVGYTDVGFGVILYGNESGNFWPLESTSQRMLEVTAINDSLFMAVGDSGLIMRNVSGINSVDEVSPAVRVNLYPNPADHQFTVTVEKGKIAAVRVYDMAGRTVMQRTSNFKNMGLPNVAPGMYQVAVETTLGRKVMPLLVQ